MKKCTGSSGVRAVAAITLWVMTMMLGADGAFAKDNASDLGTDADVTSADAAAATAGTKATKRNNLDAEFDLGTATIPEITSAMNARYLTAVELVNMYMRRIQAYNQTSPVAPAQPLNAILFLNPDLLDDAAESDRLRSKNVVLGPLHGIPFLVKGSYSIRNMPMTGGANGWRNLTTTHDSFVVEKLRQAGGLVMGQANMDTWANSATNSNSQIQGAVRSCYLAGALPGGSSGGSGVAGGAYLTHFTFGGETGGSIRNPGDRSALIGYKVSGGSISVSKIIPLAPERDVIGPMTRSAADNALIRDVVGEKDPEDIWAPILPILEDRRPVPETGFMDALDGATLAGKKIGIIGTYVGMPHPNPGPGATSNTTQVQTTTPGVFALVQQAKAEMEALGATVEYVFMPPQVSTTYDRGPTAPVTRLLNTPNSTNVAAYSYRGLIESIVGVPGDTMQTLAPKVLATAALVTQISSAVRAAMYSFNPVTGVYGEGTLIPFGSPIGVEHYTARGQQKNAFEDWMDAAGLDAVAWPMWPNKGPTTGTIIGRDLVNFMYLPSVTVPIGTLQYDATRSEPLTMDITGRLYDDANVLAIAYAYEQATQHRYGPPLAPPLPGETFLYNSRKRQDAPKEDTAPPVLTLQTKTTDKSGVVAFNGNVQDKSGVDRLEVTVGGVILASSVDAKTNSWSAVLPMGAYDALIASGATSVEVLVLAVDPSGNATSIVQSVRL